MQPLRDALWGDPPAPTGPAAASTAAAGAGGANALLAAAGEVLRHAGAHAPAATRRALLQRLLERGGGCGRSGPGLGSGSDPATPAEAAASAAHAVEAAGAATAVLHFAQGMTLDFDDRQGPFGCANSKEKPLFTSRMASGLAAAAVSEAAAAEGVDAVDEDDLLDGHEQSVRGGGSGSRAVHDVGGRVGLLARAADGGAPQLCAVVGALAAAAEFPGWSALPSGIGLSQGAADGGSALARRRAAEQLLVRLYLAAPDGVLAALMPPAPWPEADPFVGARGPPAKGSSPFSQHGDAPAERHLLDERLKLARDSGGDSGWDVSYGHAGGFWSWEAITPLSAAERAEGAARLQRGALAALAGHKPYPRPCHPSPLARRASTLLQRLSSMPSPANGSGPAAAAATAAAVLTAQHPALVAEQLGVLAAGAAPAAVALGTKGVSAAERSAAAQALQQVRRASSLLGPKTLPFL